MNTDIQELWATELESGNRVQGAGRLRRVVEDVAYECCLGVLCELAYAAGVVSRRIDSEGKCVYGATHESAVLPIEVIRWAELSEPNPHVDGRSLAEWNDGPLLVHDAVAKSFPEIAKLVRKL